MQREFQGSFGDFLAMKRGQAGLTIQDVARWLHVGSSYYNSLESGEHKAPEQLVLDRLAVILELYPADRLLMYDLAAQTHRYAAADLPKYISQYRYVLAALSRGWDSTTSMEKHPSLIQQMNKAQLMQRKG